MELQLIEFLIDTVEALLHIVRQQNSQLHNSELWPQRNNFKTLKPPIPPF